MDQNKPSLWAVMVANLFVAIIVLIVAFLLLGGLAWTILNFIKIVKGV